METGCHAGVKMDDDVHAEGWQPDLVYPPCPNNPRVCPECKGSGEAGPEATTQDDCPACDGTGWLGGKPEWPVPAAPDRSPAEPVYERLRQAAKRKRGVRLTLAEVELILNYEP